MGGLLKNAVLPYFACLHAFTFASIFLVGSKTKFAMAAWPAEYVDDELTPLENHLMGAFGAFHGAVGFACLIGVLLENSHFRGVMAMVELLFWGLDALDAIVLTKFPFKFLVVNAAIAAVGLIVHSQEPGVFTKDHGSSAAKDKTG